MSQKLKCFFGFHEFGSHHIKPQSIRTCIHCRQMWKWSYDGYAPYWQKTGEHQYTFVYCPECRFELCAGGDLLGDTDLVRYKCANCGHKSSWLFDAPVPILIKEGK